MRWSVFFLIVLNVLIFIWFVFQEDQKRQTILAERPEVFDFGNVNRIFLLGELPAAELEARDIREVAPASFASTGEGLTDVPDCALVGPFLEVISARQVKGRLGESGIESRIAIVNKEMPSMSWVYIAPQADRRKALALLKELQAKNIDSFLIADGEFENGISLGFFTNLDSAKAVMAARASEGYPVSLVEKKREQKTYWLAFQKPMAARLQGLSVESLDESAFAIRRHEKTCAEVALLEIIE